LDLKVKIFSINGTKTLKTSLFFDQLRLLEAECKKKLTNLNKTKSDLCIQLRDLCEMGTFNCLMDAVSETILRLQSTIEVKYQTKMKRDSPADSNNSSLYYHTDFPVYIQEVDATITGSYYSQQTTNMHPEQRDQPDHNVPDLRPLENNTTTPKRNKTRRSRRSNSFSKKKAPIRLDASTVISLSNVQITDDEILL